jgi:hypothetical protein
MESVINPKGFGNIGAMDTLGFTRPSQEVHRSSHDIKRPGHEAKRASVDIKDEK